MLDFCSDFFNNCVRREDSSHMTSAEESFFFSMKCDEGQSNVDVDVCTQALHNLEIFFVSCKETGRSYRGRGSQALQGNIINFLNSPW